MKTLEKAIRKYMDIDTAADLRKNKLTLCELDILRLVLMDLRIAGKSETFNTSVAEWCRKNGLQVIDPNCETVNYTISI